MNKRDYIVVSGKKTRKKQDMLNVCTHVSFWRRRVLLAWRRVATQQQRRVIVETRVPEQTLNIGLCSSQRGFPAFTFFRLAVFHSSGLKRRLSAPRVSKGRLQLSEVRLEGCSRMFPPLMLFHLSEKPFIFRHHRPQAAYTPAEPHVSSSACPLHHGRRQTAAAASHELRRHKEEQEEEEKKENNSHHRKYRLVVEEEVF